MKRQRAPRTADEFYAMSSASRDRWVRLTHAVTAMRDEKLSRAEAAKKYRVDPRRIPRSALRKRPNGRYAARPSDRLLRVLIIPHEQGNGLSEIAIRDSRQASELSRYWQAVEKYRDTGNESDLQQFSGKYIIDANGRRVLLLTDTAALDLLADAGALSFESLYAA